MKLLIATFAMVSCLGIAHADETAGEKAQETTNSAGRAISKGGHRVEEAACGTLTGDNKIQCLAKKAKNRVTEGASTVKDKGSETKKQMEDKKNEDKN